MAQPYPNHFHNGWYDTGFSMPIQVQQPCFYYTPPYTSIPHPTYVTHFPPRPSPPSPDIFPKHRGKAKLRSILKSPRRPKQSNKKKSVRFTFSTTSPPPATTGTYKCVGRSQVPRATHPARNHPCLRKPAPPQPPPQPTSRAPKQAPTPSRSTPQRPPHQPIHRPPTPPPEAFFQRNSPQQTKAQRPPQQANTAAKRQPQQSKVRPTPKTTPSYHVYYKGNSATDDRVAVVLAKKMADMQLEATRESLRKLAREFDRKNGWRVGR